MIYLWIVRHSKGYNEKEELEEGYSKKIILFR